MSCKHEESSSRSRGKAADHGLLGPKASPASNLPTRPHPSGVRLPEDAAVTNICSPASGAEAALRDTTGRAAAGMDSDVAASQQGPAPGNGSLTIAMDHLAGVSASLHLSTGKQVSACHPEEDKLLDSVWGSSRDLHCCGCCPCLQGWRYGHTAAPACRPCPLQLQYVSRSPSSFHVMTHALA